MNRGIIILPITCSIKIIFSEKQTDAMKREKGGEIISRKESEENNGVLEERTLVASKEGHWAIIPGIELDVSIMWNICFTFFLSSQKERKRRP